MAGSYCNNVQICCLRLEARKSLANEYKRFVTILSKNIP